MLNHSDVAHLISRASGNINFNAVFIVINWVIYLSLSLSLSFFDNSWPLLHFKLKWMKVCQLIYIYIQYNECINYFHILWNRYISIWSHNGRLNLFVVIILCIIKSRPVKNFINFWYWRFWMCFLELFLIFR